MAALLISRHIIPIIAIFLELDSPADVVYCNFYWFTEDLFFRLGSLLIWGTYPLRQAQGGINGDSLYRNLVTIHKKWVRPLSPNPLILQVPGRGIEPRTRGFSVQCRHQVISHHFQVLKYQALTRPKLE